MPIERIILLNKSGQIIKDTSGPKAKVFDSAKIYPIIIEQYDWDKKKQLGSSEKYKDQIKRVFYHNTIEKKVSQMLQDDIRRLKLVQKFKYGPKVLEAGCSDGSVSLKIAALPLVKKVIGFDVRQSAISDAHALIKDLLKKKVIKSTLAKKVKFIKSTIEGLPVSLGQFDSVCAYEVFEHLAPQHLLPSFLNLYRFIKKNGNFFISVPNRFPQPKYDKMYRSRWNWFDHRNFFSQLSLEIFLKRFFKEICFYPLYPGEQVKDGLYLIAECRTCLKNNL